MSSWVAAPSAMTEFAEIAGHRGRGGDVAQFSIRTECVFLIIGLRRRCVTEMSAELLCDICDSSSSQTHARKCGIVYVLYNIYMYIA